MGNRSASAALGVPLLERSRELGGGRAQRTAPLAAQAPAPGPRTPCTEPVVRVQARNAGGAAERAAPCAHPSRPRRRLPARGGAGPQAHDADDAPARGRAGGAGTAGRLLGDGYGRSPPYGLAPAFGSSSGLAGRGLVVPGPAGPHRLEREQPLDQAQEVRGVPEQVVGLAAGGRAADPRLGAGSARGAGGEEGAPLGQLGRQLGEELPGAPYPLPAAGAGLGPAAGGEDGGRGAQGGEVRGGVPLVGAVEERRPRRVRRGTWRGVRGRRAGPRSGAGRGGRRTRVPPPRGWDGGGAWLLRKGRP
ncbi:hypothetical protein STANM309S_05861 [Streptomyces tanashiensis]